MEYLNSWEGAHLIMTKCLVYGAEVEIFFAFPFCAFPKNPKIFRKALMPPKNAPSRRSVRTFPDEVSFPGSRSTGGLFIFQHLCFFQCSLTLVWNTTRPHQKTQLSGQLTDGRRPSPASQLSPVRGRRRGFSNVELGVNGCSVRIPHPQHVPRIGYMTLQLIYGGGPLPG